MSYLRCLATATLAHALVWTTVAHAQTFANLIFFGDSNTDSGRYVYVPQTVADPTTLHKGGFTTNPGLMWSTALGLRFGVTVTPSSAPGGGNNYAAGGARILHSNSTKNQWSGAQQVAAYLTSVGGVADSRALFTVDIGTNDLKTTSEAGNLGPGDYGNVVNPRNSAAIIDLGQRTAGLVAQLYAAGGRSFLVPNMFTSSSITTAGSRELYSQTVWSTIAAAGINFVPADAKSLLIYIASQPAQFGISVTSINTPACGALLSADCTAANLVTPNAATTYLYADTEGHLASGAQRIESDYFYSLLAAPSQMSYLAEAEVKRRQAVVAGVRDQVALSLERRPGLGAWVVGDLHGMQLQNGPLPSQNDTPKSLAVGIDAVTEDGWLLGGAVAYGDDRQRLDQAGGRFTSQGATGSLYMAFRRSSLWADAVASVGAQRIRTDRRVDLGIATFSNMGSTKGRNPSLATQGGYDWSYKIDDDLTVKHGPVAGVVAQTASVDSFKETAASGAPTALSFDSQMRRSTVSELGYRISIPLGAWEPFARATWNHEFAGHNREVRVSLTSTSAPVYSLPAASPGRDYANFSLGTRYALNERVRGFVDLSSQAGQARAKVVGVQIGASIQFD